MQNTKMNIENKVKYINTFDEFLEEYKKYTTKTDKLSFYRGQSNISNSKYIEWNVESTLKRIINIEDEIYRDRLSTIFSKNFYENFTKNWHNLSPPSMIELFSKMQHEGLQTPLIDFTNSIDVALWFAFSDVPSTIEYEQEIIEKLELASTNQNYLNCEINNRYANLYILEYGHDTKIKCSICVDEGNDDLKKFGGILSPPPTINRALSQNSFFILDNNLATKKMTEIKIKHSLKNDIDLFLKSKMINSQTIFPDELGFFQESVKYSEEGKLIRALSTNVDENSIDELLISIWTLKNIDKDKLNSEIGINIADECISRYAKIIEKVDLILNDNGILLEKNDAKILMELIFIIKNKSSQIWVDDLETSKEKLEIRSTLDKLIIIVTEWGNHFKNDNIDLPKDEEKKSLLQIINRVIRKCYELDKNEGIFIHDVIEVYLNKLSQQLKEKENGK